MHDDKDASPDANTDTDTDTLDSGVDTDTTDAGGSCADGAELDIRSGMTWITVCGGTFNMGSSTGDPDEMPVHSVTVPDFEMLETEVTAKQYGDCVTAGWCTATSAAADANWGKAGRENHPVNYVEWSQAVAFCTWIQGRLPSEAEWEYAASNGVKKDKYPWGEATATCTYAVMDDGGPGCGTNTTWEVCSKKAGNTSHGLCDMAGNVWEWLQDWYHPSYEGAPDDGSAWVVPVGSNRVVRGGGLGTDASIVRASNRYANAPPSIRNVDLGFRCVR